MLCLCDTDKPTNMKSLKITCALVLLVSFTFIACEDEPLTGTFTDEINVENDDEIVDEVLEPFYAKVDGNEFIEQTLEAYIFNNKLFVRAYNASGSAIIIGMSETVSESTFDFNTAEYTATYENVSNDGTSIFTTADSGSVTIVTHNVDDKLIEGTFSFVATPGASASPQYTITEGQFSVSYQ